MQLRWLESRTLATRPAASAVADPQDLDAASAVADSDGAGLSRAPSEMSLCASQAGDSEIDPAQDCDVLVHGRSARPVDTAVAGGQAHHAHPFHSRPDIGNIGFFFCNYGMRARLNDVQANIDLQIKRNPGNIIGICECQPATEEVLRRCPLEAVDPVIAAGTPADAEPAVAGPHGEPAVAGIHGRREREYLTIRGDEDVSLLLGVRTDTAHNLSLLYWKRKLEGTVKTKSGRSRCYTRLLIAEVELKLSVGFFGTQLRVANTHFHHEAANKKLGFRNAHAEYWPLLAGKLQEHRVDVLMGDFNMSLFRVVPELRRLGVSIDLLAWYPWSNEEGVAMADSCGIFLINRPAEVQLHCGIGIVPGPANAQDGGDEDVFPPQLRWNDHGGVHTLAANGGPGQLVATYLPKHASLLDKLRETLECTYADERRTSAVADTRRAPHDRVRVREKRLDVEVWKYRGANHKGSHFPLACFTNNISRRSPQRYKERNATRRDGSGWWFASAVQGRSGGGWRYETWQDERQHNRPSGDSSGSWQSGWAADARSSGYPSTWQREWGVHARNSDHTWATSWGWQRGRLGGWQD